MIIDSITASRPEQTRARYPDESGYVERDGVRVWWERYGEGDRTVLLLPTWSLVHSRIWRGQIAYLSRHARVLAFDGRGNGRSDRPPGPRAVRDRRVRRGHARRDGRQRYGQRHARCDVVRGAVGDRARSRRPRPGRAVVYIGPAVALAPGHPERTRYAFDELSTPDETAGRKYNRHAWLRDYPAFLEFFLPQCFNEPHSTKVIEDRIGWGLETTPEVLVDTIHGQQLARDESFRDVCSRVRCPTLVLHGDRDLVRPLAQGEALAAATGGRLATLTDCGHCRRSATPCE